jgi:hypothetical protein
MRKFILAIAATLCFSSAALAQPATVAITFDYWVEALSNGLPILRARGLPATFYVATESGSVDLIDYPGLPSSQQLADAEQAGWEIGIYSNVNMVTMLGALSGTPPMATPANALATKRFMVAQIDKLKAKGFVAKSYAPNQRAWNDQLANLSRDIYQAVRVIAEGGADQGYPIGDPNYVRRKAYASLGVNDTAASLCAQLDAIVAAGPVLWTIVAHKVGPTPDPYTISSTEFAGFADCLKAKRDAGLVRVTTFTKAMTPP